MSQKRLSKVMAECGIASRRKCEELIFNGKVQVNGELTLIPQTLVNLEKDKITVSGKPLKTLPSKVYYMLNKPAGYLCTSLDVAKDKSVLSLFSDNLRLFTVGRLDKDTKGLLLVTNDGHFANNVIHPSQDITKEYLAKTDQDISDLNLKALSSGALVEGTWIKPVSVKKVRKGTLKIAVKEGKKREVRVLLEAVDLKVLELKRIRIGGLTLGTLPEGEYRPLSKKEIDLFFNMEKENAE